MNPKSPYDLTDIDLREILGETPPWRISQIYKSLYTYPFSLSGASYISAKTKQKLSTSPQFDSSLSEFKKSESVIDGTIKWLWQLKDGQFVETVLMKYRRRSTVCVSTQVGCAMGCLFCATGQGGFKRNLTAGEIIEQVINAKKYALENGFEVTNVVYMGMGEPLVNFNQTVSSIKNLNRYLSLGMRRITISTVGIPGAIKKLVDHLPQINLAISLHTLDETLRSRLIPVNAKYPLPQIIEAAKYWVKNTNRRISLEWTLIDQLNDSLDNAKILANTAKELKAHVNLIEVNPTSFFKGVPPPAKRVAEFVSALKSAGVSVTIRKNMGRDINGACGQLRFKEQAKKLRVNLPRFIKDESNAGY
jgi:23S rRNA (adenine2503-C2)-methyltransferase